MAPKVRFLSCCLKFVVIRTFQGTRRAALASAFCRLGRHKEQVLRHGKPENLLKVSLQITGDLLLSTREEKAPSGAWCCSGEGSSSPSQGVSDRRNCPPRSSAGCRMDQKPPPPGSLRARGFRFDSPSGSSLPKPPRRRVRTPRCAHPPCGSWTELPRLPRESQKATAAVFRSLPARAKFRR